MVLKWQETHLEHYFQSLWVRWIHSYRLENRNFWEVRLRADASWGWRKILQIRDSVRNLFITKIGNGLNASAWYDNWCDIGSLSSHVSSRDIFRMGMNNKAKVNDLIINGNWCWPEWWKAKYPIVAAIQIPVLKLNKADQIRWRDVDNTEHHFSVSIARNTLRDQGNSVS